MKPAFDLAEVRLLLRRGLEAGYWTIDQLDEPSPGWKLNARHFAMHYPKCQQPQYRNLLRDEPTTTERVQITDPRDFPLAEAAPDHVQRGSAPLPMATHRSVAESFSDSGLQGHEGSVGDEADHGDETHLGTAWEVGSFGAGDVSEDW